MGATQLVSHAQGGTCSNCGAQLEPDACFCIVCGTPVSKPEKSAAPVKTAACAQCGAPLEEGAQFCVVCGAPVGDTAMPQDAAFETQPQSDYCPNCGWPLDPGALYCISCGFKVESAAFQSPEPHGSTGTVMTSSMSQVPIPGTPINLVPAPPLADDDDDATVRPRLVMLTREEARTGCCKTVEIDRDTHESIEVHVPAGVNVNTKLDAPGYGFFDEVSGQRGPLRLTFFIG